MGTYIALLCVGVLCVALYLFVRSRKPSITAVLIKICSSLIFISISGYGLYLHFQSLIALMFVIGMFFGLIGDIVLDLKFIYPNDDRLYTLAGFTSFGIGHVFFMAGMFREYYHGESALYIILPFVFGLLMAVVTLLLEKPTKLRYGEMKIIVFIYAIFLFSMAGTALSVSILHNFASTSLILLTIGGVLFAISDLVLSNSYFGGKDKSIPVLIMNILTYYSAQFLLASAIFFL